MPSWKYTNLLLVKIDIQEENGGEGAPEEQYDIYQALELKYSKENCLNFNALNDIKVVLRLQAVLKGGNSEYTRYRKV